MRFFHYSPAVTKGLKLEILIICCHVTNLRDDTEHLLLMKTVRYSREIQDQNLRL